jgi:2-polyprenyl-6-methoxyphenol hydroxylase-like FAD-dependent oxidoreductase
MTSFKIAVIGAGLGGLTLARVLQKRGVGVTVYERETSSLSRDQGGILDMHKESGQAALEAAGLTPEFIKIANPKADCMKIVNKDGIVTYRDLEPEEGGHGGMHNRPEVDRGQLRQIIIDSLAPGTVKWGHRFSSCKEVGDNVELTFSQPDITVTCDVVIGADGTWSRVRPFLSSAVPEYSGVTFIDTQLTDLENKNSDIATTIGKGTLSALGDRIIRTTHKR